MKIKCWNCGHEFEGSLSQDAFGWYSYCDECDSSFDVDIEEYVVPRGTMVRLEDGRICIITFHSLEDRIVKTIFKKNENPCTCPTNFPVCVCGKVSKGRVISRKPILPSEEELEINSRSKSAKLRVAEKI